MAEQQSTTLYVWPELLGLGGRSESRLLWTQVLLSTEADWLVLGSRSSDPVRDGQGQGSVATELRGPYCPHGARIARSSNPIFSEPIGSPAVN